MHKLTLFKKLNPFEQSFKLVQYKSLEKYNSYKFHSSKPLQNKTVNTIVESSTKLYESDIFHTLLTSTMYGSAALGIATLLAFPLFRYKISSSDQYLVRTGLGIKDMKISKTGMRWPFQEFRYIDMRPNNYTFNLQAMSSQKMEFVLPGVFTIGPKDDFESLIKYSRYLLDDDQSENKIKGKSHIDSLVEGIIEGETRVLAAQMTIDEIFSDRATFKSKIIKNVQEELDQFGLLIFNANIKELQDTPGSEYFTFLRQKTKSEAEGNARIDTSEAKKNADIGVKQRELETRKQVAEYEALAIEKENENKKKIVESNALLSIVQADTSRKVQIANIEADKNAKIREVELQMEVEQRNILQETEHKRSVELSKAIVNAEKEIKTAEGEKRSKEINADALLYQKTKEADGDLYQTTKAAEGKLLQMTKEAEGRLIQMIKDAEGSLCLTTKEADGIKLTYEAQSEGVTKLLNSFDNDQQKFMQYLMVDKDLYTKLAKSNADAIQGLNPKITVWNTGNDSSKNNMYTDTIRNVVQMIPPLFNTIHDQTGMSPIDILKGTIQENDKPQKV